MFNLKKETILTLSIISLFIFFIEAGFSLWKEESPIKLTINDIPFGFVVILALAFFIFFALYNNSIKAIKEYSEK